jgi:thiosulfate/3-mercaptopyruvate sulfurtransferase
MTGLSPPAPDRTSAIVDTVWVQAHLDDPDVRLVEVDRDTIDYRRSHLPGALGWHCGDDLRARDRRDLASRSDIADLLRRSGVADGTTVVLYGNDDDTLAAFAYWVLRYRGCERVRLMDGGRRRWVAEDRALSNETVRPVPAEPGTLGPDLTTVRIGRDALLARADDDVVIVDVRSPAEFSGEMVAPPHLPHEGAQHAGHIPGAVNVPWGRCLAPLGGLRPVDELSALFADAGVTADHEVIVHCRLGDRSAHTWFVLHEVLGYPRVSNYDGSWTEYGSLVGVPVEP